VDLFKTMPNQFSLLSIHARALYVGLGPGPRPAQARTLQAGLYWPRVKSWQNPGPGLGLYRWPAGVWGPVGKDHSHIWLSDRSYYVNRSRYYVNQPKAKRPSPGRIDPDSYISPHTGPWNPVSPTGLRPGSPPCFR